MRYIPELDAVRGIAAIIIVLFHVRFMGMFPLWGTAVDLFFVLSGYLITTIILEKGGTPGFFKAFYARRALRILPIYYLTFPVFLIVNPLLPHPSSLRPLPYYLTYTQFIQGYWFGKIPEFSMHFRHTWTLAIEEQFYLIWPILVVATGRRLLPVAIAPFLFGPFFMRIVGFFPHLLITRCDGLALGALLAWFFDVARSNEYLLRRARYTFVWIAVAAYTGSWWLDKGVGRIASLYFSPDRVVPIVWSWIQLRIAIMFFGITGLLVCATGENWLKPLRAKPLLRLGRISYGIYLYHPLVGVVLGLCLRAFHRHGTAWTDALRIVLCVVVSALSWRFIEEPILRFKNRFPYRERESVPVRRGVPRPAFARQARRMRESIVREAVASERDLAD